MNKIRKYFNGYTNMLTVVIIAVGIVISVIAHRLPEALLWVLVLSDFMRCITLEKIRDDQHEIIVSQRDRINRLEKTLAELTTTK